MIDPKTGEVFSGAEDVERVARVAKEVLKTDVSAEVGLGMCMETQEEKLSKLITRKITERKLTGSGISTLEYFMAHAPYPVPEWFEPILPTYKVLAAHGLEDRVDMTHFKKHRDLQWPIYWAKEMIKRSGE